MILYMSSSSLHYKADQKSMTPFDIPRFVVVLTSKAPCLTQTD